MMKSYTLNNWDGNVAGSEEKTPQTVSNSLTSAHVLVSNLQTSDSSYNVNFEKTVSNTLYGGEHGKEGIGTDNNVHDASIEGGSIFDSWVNGEVYITDDIPSSSTEPSRARQDGNRTAPWIAEGESSFRNASGDIGASVVAENHAYSQSLLLPGHTAGMFGEARLLKTPNLFPDASTKTTIERAPDSTAKDLDSDTLTPSTTAQFSSKNFSNEITATQKGLMFIPDLSSPLHTRKLPDLSRRSPMSSNASRPNVIDLSMDSPLSSIYLHSDLPSPGSENLDLDVISIHTVDGEGTDEDDEVIILENIPSSHTPEKPVNRVDVYESLFTPPPSDGYVAPEDLFTPPPTKHKPHRPSQKILMSHVSLPPPRHQTNNARISRPPPKKKPGHVSQVQVHNDLARAMQASWDNNDSLGTLPQKRTTEKPKLGRPKKKAKEPKPPGDRHPVAGPSRFSSQSTSASKGVQQPKRRRNDFEDREQSVSISSKRARITIDLTLADDSNEKKKRKHNEKAKSKLQPIVPISSAGKMPVKTALPPARTKYDAKQDCVRLFLGAIKNTPPDLVLHNTRFVRRRIYGTTSMDDTHEYLEVDTRSSSRARREKVEVNWPLPRTRLKTTDSEGEISLGGHLFWAEGSDDDDEEGDNDDDDVVVNHAPPTKAAPSSSVPPAPPPPRIDLAAQFKKRQRKSQTSAPHNRRASTTATVSVSPSRSLRITNINTLTTSPSVPARSDAAGLATTPSAKALGKRKAASPTPSAAAPAYHAPTLDYPNHTLGDHPQDTNNHPHPYLQTLPLQSSLSASSSTIGTYPQAPPTFVPLQYFQYYYNLTSGTTFPNAQPSPHDPATQSGDWTTSTATSSQEYTYTTIDPTLLGGHSMAPTFQEPNIGLEDGPHVDSLDINDIFNLPSSPAQQAPRLDLAVAPRLESHNDVFPSPSLAQLSAQIEEYDPSTNVFPSMLDAEEPFPIDSSPSPIVSAFKLPPRRRRSTTSVYASSGPSSDDDNDDYSESEVVVNKPKPLSVAPTSQSPLLDLPAQSSTPLLTTGPRTNRGQYPLASSAEYCHQCRCKNFTLKMICHCSKRFCYRCITIRYPDKNFNFEIEQQTCPYCDRYCNCTACCLKRGVPYVSSRYQTISGGATTTKVSLRAASSTKPPLVLPRTVPPPNAQYWGAIYSLDGQKIGTTFAAPAANGLPPVVFSGSAAQPLTGPPKLKRTFVGRVQYSWGFGRNRLIKELNAVKKKKSRTKGSGKTRSFIGDATFVRYHLRLSTPGPLDEDLLDGLSPLTSLTDTDDDDKLGKVITMPPEGTKLNNFSPFQLLGN